MEKKLNIFRMSSKMKDICFIVSENVEKGINSYKKKYGILPDDIRKINNSGVVLISV